MSIQFSFITCSFNNVSRYMDSFLITTVFSELIRLTNSILLSSAWYHVYGNSFLQPIYLLHIKKTWNSSSITGLFSWIQQYEQFCQRCLHLYDGQFQYKLLDSQILQKLSKVEWYFYTYFSTFSSVSNCLYGMQRKISLISACQVCFMRCSNRIRNWEINSLTSPTSCEIQT